LAYAEHRYPQETQFNRELLARIQTGQ